MSAALSLLSLLFLAQFPGFPWENRGRAELGGGSVPKTLVIQVEEEAPLEQTGQEISQS